MPHCSHCRALVARVWDEDCQHHVNVDAGSWDHADQDFDPTGLGHRLHVCREQYGPPVPDRHNIEDWLATASQEELEGLREEERFWRQEHLHRRFVE